MSKITKALELAIKEYETREYLAQLKPQLSEAENDLSDVEYDDYYIQWIDYLNSQVRAKREQQSSK